MTTVAEITGAVKRLPKKDLARFRKWFVGYDAAAWDKQLESDFAAGKLDAFAREALREHKASPTRKSGNATSEGGSLDDLPNLQAR